VVAARMRAMSISLAVKFARPVFLESEPSSSFAS
jgi:hypothetical protein